MKARILNICLGIALVGTGYLFGHHSTTVVHAQENASIPKAWGKVIGTTGSGLLLEDGAGTLRVVDYYGRVVVMVGRN